MASAVGGGCDVTAKLKLRLGMLVHGRRRG